MIFSYRAGAQGISEMAQQMALMRAIQGSGGGNSNPLMAMALMRQMQQRRQQQQPQQQPQPQPAQPQPQPQPDTPQVPSGQPGPRPQWTPPAGFPGAVVAKQQVQIKSTASGNPGKPPSAPPKLPSNISRPPPEFIAMMKKMGQQIRARTGQGPQQVQVPPSGGPQPASGSLSPAKA